MTTTRSEAKVDALERLVIASRENVNKMQEVMNAMKENLVTVNKSLHHLSELKSLVEIMIREKAYEKPETKDGYVPEWVDHSLGGPAKGDRAFSSSPNAKNFFESAMVYALEEAVFGACIFLPYFRIHGTPTYHGLQSAHIHMEGPAVHGFQWVKSRTPNWNWYRFAEELIHRYSRRKATNPFEELASLRQGGRPVEDYIKGFEVLLATTVGGNISQPWERRQGGPEVYMGRAHAEEKGRMGGAQVHERTKGMDDPPPLHLGRNKDVSGPANTSTQAQQSTRQTKVNTRGNGRIRGSLGEVVVNRWLEIMPPLSDRELEERLSAAGNALYRPPSSLDELLRLLDRIEELLSKMEQSPAKSMLTPLSPLMDALIAEDFLKHSDVDVKVDVASCISEITRITAPDAPYDDDKMKEVFHLIVSSFEDWYDASSRSIKKRQQQRQNEEIAKRQKLQHPQQHTRLPPIQQTVQSHAQHWAGPGHHMNNSQPPLPAVPSHNQYGKPRGPSGGPHRHPQSGVTGSYYQERGGQSGAYNSGSYPPHGRGPPYTGNSAPPNGPQGASGGYGPPPNYPQSGQYGVSGGRGPNQMGGNRNQQYGWQQ
ncbi:cyclin-dependent kinase C-1-like [Dorcoceras hygrometricum]|nr:cyclin-dependent kinase C-1-like [Dorcoceras hygrometricum]